MAKGKAEVKQYEESEEEMPLVSKCSLLSKKPRFHPIFFSNFQSKRKKPLESESEEEKPLSARKKVKAEVESDEEELPLAARKKVKTEKKAKKKKSIESEASDDESFDEKPKKKKIKKEKQRVSHGQ